MAATLHRIDDRAGYAPLIDASREWLITMLARSVDELWPLTHSSYRLQLAMEWLLESDRKKILADTGMDPAYFLGPFLIDRPAERGQRFSGLRADERHRQNLRDWAGIKEHVLGRLAPVVDGFDPDTWRPLSKRIDGELAALVVWANDPTGAEHLVLEHVERIQLIFRPDEDGEWRPVAVERHRP
jgi:hypothetical protein